MNKTWHSGNSYLRLLSSLPEEPGKRMTIYTLSESERRLVSEEIQMFEKRMSTIGVKITTITTNTNDGTTKFALSVSKEMCS